MRVFKPLVTAPKPETARADTATAIRDVLAQDLRFVALDVETANGDPASICQIGLACVTQGGAVIGLGFLVKPRGRFERFNSELHGIDAEMVRDAPPFSEVVQALRPLLEQYPMIQHSGFDKRAMNGACVSYGLPTLNSVWHDSVTIARRAWPQLRGNGGHGLASLKAFLDLDFHHHDAVEDARAAALVVLRAEAATGRHFADLAATQGGTAPRKASQAAPVRINREGPLFGLVACITGKLTISRTKAVARAADAGVAISSGMADTVHFLVVSDSDLFGDSSHGTSAKYRQAVALIEQGHRLKIIRESEFWALLGDSAVHP